MSWLLRDVWKVMPINCGMLVAGHSLVLLEVDWAVTWGDSTGGENQQNPNGLPFS